MADLLTSPQQVGLIILRTLVVYAFILVGFRLAGKREVGQLAPFDFALILLIANAVQNAMVGSDSSLLGGLVAAAVLLVANRSIGRLVSRSRKLERIVRGRARLLVHKGVVDEEHLEIEGLTHEDLMQALRENGCATVHDCRMAVLEVDGTISVIAKQDQAPGPGPEPRGPSR